MYPLGSTGFLEGKDIVLEAVQCSDSLVISQGQDHVWLGFQRVEEEVC